jgi:hypothetical protein
MRACFGLSKMKSLNVFMYALQDLAGIFRAMVCSHFLKISLLISDDELFIILVALRNVLEERMAKMMKRKKNPREELFRADVFSKVGE